jgi:hypothetical protein
VFRPGSTSSCSGFGGLEQSIQGNGIGVGKEKAIYALTCRFVKSACDIIFYQNTPGG